MTIRADLEPVQCRLVRIYLELNNEMLIRSDAEIDIFNANGTHLMRHTTAIPWTAAEQTTIESVVSFKYQAFKAVNDLTEWIDPEGEE